MVSEKVAARPGGYTRILKMGNRMGDNAEIAMIELVDFNDYFQGFSKEKSTAKKTTRRSRSKAKSEVTASESAEDSSEG